MWARKRIDIAWLDLAFAAVSCWWPFRRATLQDAVLREWSEQADSLCFLSVRTAFDVLWEVLKLPPGSEVLMSAVTIPDMVQIVREHGLVPIPVDLSLSTLAIDVESVEKVMTPRTRAIVVAHLFGSRMPLDSLVRLAREQGWLLIEDAAQAYQADPYRGHPQADVAMFSFGPIKTATALGGALVNVRDPELRAAMRVCGEQFPCQSRGAYGRRVLKYCGVKLLSQRTCLALFVWACRLLALNYASFVSRIARGFPRDAWVQKIRQQPSLPLLALLRRRLVQSRASVIDERSKRGARVAAMFEEAFVAGRCAQDPSHWVIPVVVPERNKLVSTLAKAGYDVSCGESLALVSDPGERRSAVKHAAELISGLVFLPDTVNMSVSARQRLVRLIEAHVRRSAREAVPPEVELASDVATS